MLRRSFYTIWKGKADGSDDPVLLEDEPLFNTKHRAFKRARQLADKLVVGWEQAILVRYVTVGSDLCTEWVFTPDGATA